MNATNENLVEVMKRSELVAVEFTDSRLDAMAAHWNSLSDQNRKEYRDEITGEDDFADDNEFVSAICLAWLDKQSEKSWLTLSPKDKYSCFSGLSSIQAKDEYNMMVARRASYRNKVSATDVMDKQCCDFITDVAADVAGL